MYAITGATGHLGRKVVASLKNKVPSSETVAVVRDPAKAVDLGIAARQADYYDPASLRDALAGVERLLLISSGSMDGRVEQHENVVAAARDAGVRHLVYTSCLHAERWGLPFAEEHGATERIIVASGLAHTLLRNGWYWENHTAALGPAVAHGALTGSAGAAPISYASRQDFAEAAVATLTEEGHVGQTYELAGDRAYTIADIAAEAERQTGRPVAYRNLSQDDHARFLESVGLPAVDAAMVAEMEGIGVGSGVLKEDGGMLSRLIGRPTTTLTDAVAAALSR